MDESREDHTKKVRRRKTVQIYMISEKWYQSYVESKNDSNELIYKTETDSDLGNKLIVMKGEGGREDKSECWD